MLQAKGSFPGALIRRFLMERDRLPKPGHSKSFRTPPVRVLGGWHIATLRPVIGIVPAQVGLTASGKPDAIQCLQYVIL